MYCSLQCVCLEQWRIPKELHVCVENLPVPQPTLSVYVHILVAKARLFVQSKVRHLSDISQRALLLVVLSLYVLEYRV